MKYVNLLFIAIGIIIILIAIITRQYYWIVTGVLIAIVNWRLWVHGNAKKKDGQAKEEGTQGG